MTMQDPANDVEASRQRLLNAMRTGVSQDPDALARDRAEAQRRGVSVQTLRAARDIGSPIPAPEVFELPRTAPRTAAYLSDPARAAVAHDDTENMSAAETLLRGVGARATNLLGGLGRSALATPTNPINVIEGAVERLGIPRFTIDIGMGGVDVRRQTATDNARTQSLAAVRRAENATLGYEAMTTWDDVKAQPLRNFLPFALESGIVSAPDMAAAIVNLPAYVSARTGEIGQQRAENDGQVDATVGDLIAALPAAAASSALERLGARGILGLDDALVGGVRGILPAAARGGVKEAITEGAQSVIEYGGTNIGTQAGFDPAQALEQGIAGAVAGGPFGATVRGVTASIEATTQGLRRGQADVQAAEEGGQVVDRLAAIAQASALRERDPQSFQEFIDAAAEGSAVENVYIDAQAFAQAAGPNLGEILNAVPEIKEQIDGALASGGDLRISSGNFAAHIAGTDYAQPMLEHLKVDPFDMSRAQAKDFLANQAEQLKAEVEAAVAAGQQDEAFQASADRVREGLSAELEKAGRFSKDVNDAYAAVVSNFYATTAARLGLTPEQMAERYPLRVNGELPGTPRANTLDQQNELELIHFSGQPDLVRSDPNRWGATRATPDSERQRREAGAPPRTYFGVRGVYGGELGVGIGKRPRAYSARVPADRIYDFDADPQNLRPALEDPLARATAYEQAIRDAGFMGYRSDAVVPGAVAVFDPVDLTPSERVFNQALTPAQAAERAERLANEIPGLKGVLPYLSADEKAKLRRDTAAKITQLIEDFPSAEEMAAVAYSGRAKRGWYENSAKAILDIFGAKDAPRFAALLAALSPQTSVEANAFNALASWTNWINAGRPTERREIIAILGRSVQGTGTEASVLNAWINNSVEALTAENPNDITLSGPKVNSFMLNLIGVVDEVTNDAWMANYALVEQSVFKKTGAVPGKGPGYIAMNAVARRAAEIVSEKTGDDWSAAEVQETVWSWAKTLYEKRDTAGEDRTTQEILAAGGLTAEDIGSTPDFAVLFVDGVFRRILEAGGYGAELEAIDQRGQPARRDGAGSDPRSVEGTSFDEGDFVRYVDQAAARLEELRARRRGASDPQSSLFAQGPVEQEAPLEGQPQVVNIPGRGRTVFGPFAKARQVARDYMASAGLVYSPPTQYAKVDEDRARRIAQAFEDMKHDPSNPTVKAAYRAMIDETLAQYQAIKETGLKIEFITGADPYAATPRLAILDVVENNHLWVFPTDDGFGSSDLDVSDNPLLEMTGEFIDGRELRANDVFRIVHDYFGHIKDGNGFRADGEENAWQSHAAMYSPLARRAMTTETRGQNSWVNYGPHAEKNRTASASETVYADQKIGLLPEWVSTEGFLGGLPLTRQTDSEAFRAWFGDSKVVDENGNPQVVYHGTPFGPIDAFDQRELVGPEGVSGFFFSEDRDVAARFETLPYEDPDVETTPQTVAAYLSIQNPARIDRDVQSEMTIAEFFEEVGLSRADVPAELQDRADEPSRMWLVYKHEPEVFAALRAKGFDGFTALEDGAPVWVAFEPTQIKSVDNRGTFDPTDPRILFQENRGQIAFAADITSSPSTISLLRTADLSTFLHETGHFFLEVTAHIANQPDAPADILADMSHVFRWFGDDLDLAKWNTMTPDQRRPYHEQFARGFEAYLFEGRAPSTGMRALFRRFSAWMKNVYKSLTALNVELTDEVRSVFDRMLASAEDIRVVEQARSFAPMLNEKPDTMTTDEWTRYQELGVEATQEAIENLEGRNLRDMQWASNAKSRALKALQREAEEQRKAVRAEVTAEVMAEPVNRARTFLRRGLDGEGNPVEGAAKLDLAALKTQYGDGGLWTQLRRGGKYGEVATDGLLPDVVADMFGYPTGEALIADLVNGENATDKIAGLTDQRMLERYGDLSSPEALERAANEAVANDTRLKFVAAESAALSKAVGRRQLLNEAARSYAASVVNRLPLKRLRPSQYVAAQTRAAKEADAAFRKGDLAGAATAKRNQLINLHTGKAVQDAQREVEKGMRLFKRIVSANNDALSKTRNMDLVNAARAILTAYGMGRVKNDPTSYMDALAKYDPTLYADLKPFVDGARGDAKPMPEISFEQFVALRDTVNQLWTMARREKVIEIDGKLVDRKVATAALEARMDEIGYPENPAGQTRAVNDKDNRVRSLLGIRAALRRVESWARGIDGADQGPFRTYIWNPISEAADRYRGESATYIRRFRELLDTVKDELAPRDIAAPEIGYTFGGKAELYHALLHTGNGSNKSKLLLGRRWGKRNAEGELDSSVWDGFIDRLHAEGVLTAKDWTFVQAVWDLMEETKPGAQRAHRAIYGRYFDEIAADPVDTPFGQLRGGYVPALTDAFLVQDAALRAEQEAIEGGDSAMFPAASNGFTKSRVEDYTRELALDLRLLTSHIDKVLKFTHLGPPVRDVARILKDRGFSRNLQNFDPTAATDLLLPWLQRAAKQIVETPSKGIAGKAADRFFSAVRSRVGMQLMFANVVNTAQQVTGFSNVLLRVEAPFLGEALWRYVRDPKGVADQASSMSAFLRNRMDSDLFEARQAITQLTNLNPSRKDQVVDFATRHAYFMQSALQNVMDVISWSAAYDKATARGDDDRAAIRFADSVIRETQGTMAPEDVSRFETGAPFVRMFTQFAGYFNMMANLNATEVQQVARDVGLRKGAGRLFYVYLMGFAIPALLGDAIAKALRGGWEDENEDGSYLDDMLAWFFSSQARFALAAVPGVGQVGNALIGTTTGQPYDDRLSISPAVSVIEAAVTVPREVYEAITGKEDFNRTDTRNTLNLLGILTGTPAGALAKPAGYGVGVAQGDIEPTGPADVARGVVTGAPSPESRVE